MSRGLGRIERAILDVIEEDEAADLECVYAAEDLAERVYRPKAWPTRAQQVATLRAMHALAAKCPDKIALTGGKGRNPLWLYRPEDGLPDFLGD